MKKILFLISYLRRRWIFIFYPLFIIFVIPPNFSWLDRAIFFLYAIFIFLILIYKVKTNSVVRISTNKFFIVLFLISLVVILVSRLLPFIHFGEAPLGYDTGFYIRDISAVNHAVLGDQGTYPEKIFYFIFVPFNLLGIPPIYALHFIYIISQFLLAGSLYFLFNSLKFKHHFEYACVAVFIFAISATQFYAYWSMFPKQLLALSLFLLSTGLILRRSYLAILTIIFGVLMNVPTFAVFMIGAIMYCIIRLVKIFFQKVYSRPKLFLGIIFIFSLLFFLVLTKWEIWFGQSPEVYAYLIRKGLYYGRWLVFLPILILLIQFFTKKKVFSTKVLFIFFFFFISWNVFYWGQDYRSIIDVIDYIVKYKGLAINFPAWKMDEIKGIFITIYSFRDLNMSIIPFALFTFLRPVIWQENNCFSILTKKFLVFIYVMFFILFILVSFPFIYQYRFVVIFDIFFIIFVVPSVFLLANYWIGDKFGSVLIVVFILVFVLNIIHSSWIRQPQLYPDELQELKNLDKITEENALVLATDSAYTPWVQGFSGRQAHGPGYGGDTWGLSEWMSFWIGSDDSIRYQLLNSYDQPLYLFIGYRQPPGQRFQQFIKDSSYFEQVSPHVWRYYKDL